MLYSTIQWDLKIGVGVFLEVTKNYTQLLQQITMDIGFVPS